MTNEPRPHDHGSMHELVQLSHDYRDLWCGACNHALTPGRDVVAWTGRVLLHPACARLIALAGIEAAEPQRKGETGFRRARNREPGWLLDCDCSMCGRGERFSLTRKKLMAATQNVGTRAAEWRRFETDEPAMIDSMAFRCLIDRARLNSWVLQIDESTGVHTLCPGCQCSRRSGAALEVDA